MGAETGRYVDRRALNAETLAIVPHLSSKPCIPAFIIHVGGWKLLREMHPAQQERPEDPDRVPSSQRAASSAYKEVQK